VTRNKDTIIRRLVWAGIPIFLARPASEATHVMSPIELVEAAKNLPKPEQERENRRWWFSLPLRVLPKNLRSLLWAKKKVYASDTESA
jgi:hypothetical protein